MNCEGCGNPVERKHNRGPHPRYCSNKCRQDVYEWAQFLFYLQKELGLERKQAENLIERLKKDSWIVRKWRVKETIA